MQQIGATHCHDALPRQQITSCDMWKSLSLWQNFVAAICRTNSNWFEFMRHIATYSDKISASSLVAAAVQTRWLVAATEWLVAVMCGSECHIVCLGLKWWVFCYLLVAVIRKRVSIFFMLVNTARGSMEEGDCVGLEKCGVSSSDLQSKDRQMKILVSELVQSQFFYPGFPVPIIERFTLWAAVPQSP